MAGRVLKRGEMLGGEAPAHREHGICRCYDCMVKKGAFLQPELGLLFDALSAIGWDAYIISQDGEDHITIRAKKTNG